MVFAEDIFGDQFGIAVDSVVLLSSESGEIAPLASRVEEWACRGRWQLEHGPIARGNRLAGKMPFILGGNYDLPNLYEIDSVKAMRLRGHIYRQITISLMGVMWPFELIDEARHAFGSDRSRH